jgi:hypothetical protein
MESGMPYSADLEAVCKRALGISRLWIAGAPPAARRTTTWEMAWAWVHARTLLGADVLRLTNFTEHSAISKLSTAGAASQRRE